MTVVALIYVIYNQICISSCNKSNKCDNKPCVVTVAATVVPLVVIMVVGMRVVAAKKSM